MYHKPVLKEEVSALLQVKKDKNYIDATLGDGGHSLEILKQGGAVLGIDINSKSLERAVERIEAEGYALKFTAVQGNFMEITELAQQRNFNNVSGVLFDLGYSSYQLDEGGYGLSFRKDELLDMRLDSTLGVTAADLVNSLSEKELTVLVQKYSGEILARKFAKAIVKARNLRKIQTSKELADILNAEASPGYEHGRINPATRTFQALRIVVNDELANLEKALPRAARLLVPGGRMVVITFHSLEDKVVKVFGKNAQLWLKSITDRPLEPSEKEIFENERSRSAKLRAFEKI